MKKLTVILTTLLALTLAGCGEEKSETASEPQAEESTTTETQPAEPASEGDDSTGTAAQD